MNGARSIFMRKGYWLTAFAAAVLLAASPGTASAQLTITAPETVDEGESVTMAVTLKGFIPAAVDIDEDGVIQDNEANAQFNVTVTWGIQPGIATDTTTPGEDGEGLDISTGLNPPGAITFEIEENDTLNRVPFSETRLFTVQTLQDVDAEDEDFVWSFTSIAGFAGLEDEDGEDLVTPTGLPTTLTIEDNEPQKYVLDVTTKKPTEGMTVSVTVKAEPRHVQGSVELTLHLDDGEYTWSNDATSDDEPFTLGAPNDTNDATVADNMAVITIQTPADGDGNRVEDSVTLTAFSGSVGRATPRVAVTIKVADANELPAVEMVVVDEDGDPLDTQPTSVEEGETIEMVVMVDDEDAGDKATEDLVVALTANGMANAADYTPLVDFKIGTGMSKSEPVKLTVSENDDVGDETLIFDAEVEGDPDIGPGSRVSPGVLALTIEDKTDPQITPLSSDAADTAIDGKIADGAGADGLNPTESFAFDPSDLFTSEDGYGATYTTTVSDDGVISETSSGGIVTITALKAGSGTVTVTGRATMTVNSLNASSSQAVAYAADITFDVEVVDKPLVVEVSTDPADMVDEGGTVMVIATSTTRAVLADEEVTVDLTVSGPVEGDGHSITIAPGAETGSTELTVMNDDVVSALSDVVITATGPGIDGAMVLSLSVTENDEAAVPPDPENVISAKPEADAYPLIRAALGNDPTNTVMNTGDTGTITASDLFEVDEGYTASYSADVVEGDAYVTASQAGGTITVTADAAGESKVTITGSATMAASSFAPSQDATNIASITFLVMVEDTPLEVTELTAEPMEIEAGGTSTITATVNRYVTDGDGEVTIDLSVVGDGTLDAESITIAAGAMSGSAMLTANESVTVVATGDGISGLLQVEVTVTAAPEPDPEPIPNPISAKPEDEAYPVIMAAIAAGAGDDEMLTPGESVELMGSALFTVMDGYDATYRVSVDSAAVSGLADGDSISVTAASAGDAKVTITGTATMMAASSFDASQDATNVASITFPVTVEAEPEPVVPEPVPALPLIAQWLLGLGLMGGGARKLYRRRRQQG